MGFRERAIWTHSKAEGHSLLLLLAIADYGEPAYPSIRTLAAKTKMSERATQRLLRRLMKAGEIKITPGGGRGFANTYVILLPGCEKGDSSATLSVTNGDPGDTLSTIKGDFDDTLSSKRVTNEVGKGDTAMTPQVLRSTKKKRKEALPLPPIPSSLNTPEFCEAWEMWVSERIARRNPLSELAAKLQFKELEQVGPAVAVVAIHKSIASGWKGIHINGDLGRSLPTTYAAKEAEIEVLVKERSAAKDRNVEWPQHRKDRLDSLCKELGIR